MQFYPMNVLGAEWDDNYINELVDWDEEEYGKFDVSDWEHREIFESLMYDVHGIEASIKEFEWVKGGYVQGLTGLAWDTIYLIIDLDGEDKNLIQEKLDLPFEEGSYSQLG